MANDMSAEIPISEINLDKSGSIAPSIDPKERYRQEAASLREMFESNDPTIRAEARERKRLLRILTSEIHAEIPTEPNSQTPDPDKELLPDIELTYPVDPEKKRVFDKAVARAVGLFRFFPDEADRILQKLRDPGSRDKAIRELEKLEAIRVKENE